MPGKHVRFSERNQAFSPPSRPSPTFSNLTLSPSPGPSTPPPLHYTGSPYSYAPLPPVDDEPERVPTKDTYTVINPVLGLKSKSLVPYDLSYDPSITRPVSSSAVLAQPATSPPQPSMTITCKQLPFNLTIPASSAKPGACVTVGDVIMGIYAALRMGASQDDFDRIPGRAGRKQIEDAFKHRYERVGDPKKETEEKKKGMKRVDFLMQKHQFMGLSSTSKGPNVWQMHVS